MKKLLVLSSLVLCLTSVKSFAQKDEKHAASFKPFKVDLALGYAIPGGTGAKGGILFAVEPKYAVMPNLSVGLRMEGAVMARASGYDNDGNVAEADVKASGSYVATADYYLTDNSFRPFVGAGAGIYSLAGAQVTSSSTGTVGTSSKFGGLVRAGIEAGHFRLGLEYNIVPSTTYDGYDSNGDPAKVKSKNGYIGIKIGAFIGGGRR